MNMIYEIYINIYYIAYNIVVLKSMVYIYTSYLFVWFGFSGQAGFLCVIVLVVLELTL